MPWALNDFDVNVPASVHERDGYHSGWLYHMALKGAGYSSHLTEVPRVETPAGLK